MIVQDPKGKPPNTTDPNEVQVTLFCETILGALGVLLTVTGFAAATVPKSVVICTLTSPETAVEEKSTVIDRVP